MLHGADHKLLPDMIEVGSFIGMAAMCGDGVRIKDVSIKDLGIIPDAFRRLGVKVEEEGDDLFIPHQKHYVVDSFIDGTIMTLADAPWPGLTPDLLSVLIVVATQGRGSVLFHQKMFLIDMGAQIILCDPHRAVVVGHDRQRQLRGSRMSSPDIRAGIALLIAAMSANGTSLISNIEQIDRGYLGKAHGVKGEVSFQFDDDIFDRVDADYLVLDIDGILVPFFMEEYRFRSDTVCLVKFKGVDTQQRAQELTGCDVFFPRALAEEGDEMPSLASLVGFDIVNVSDGRTIGNIAAIDDSTVNILFELEDGTLIPASDELITNIDAEQRTIRMNIPEGLLDI